MSIWANLLSRLGYYKKGTDFPSWALAVAEANESWSPDYTQMTAQVDLYRVLSWVHIAVDAIAKASAVVALNVMKIHGDETSDIPNHDFEMLLEHPSKGTDASRYELLYSTVANYSLTGNAYWWLNKSSEAAEPEEIWVIPSNQIRPVPDGRMYIKGYEYDAQGQVIALEPWEVVHFKQYNPNNPWLGLSPIEAIGVVSKGDLGMQAWNTKLFAESNGKLPGILAFADPIPDNEWELIKRDTREKANKRDLMMLRNVRAGGIQWIQATVSQRDMEFLSGRKSNREEIYSIFAPGLYGMLSENATEANARTAKATFADYCLWPMLENMAQKITNSVLPSYGDNLRAQFEDVRITDRALELQEIAAYSQTHTIDEIRQKYYEDDPIAEITQLDGDQRGFMFVAQISPNTPIEEGDDPEPIPPQFTDPMLSQQEEVIQESEPDEPTEAPGEDTGEAAQEDAELQAELKRWERKSLKRFRSGKGALCEFESEIIPTETGMRIYTALDGCQDEASIKAVFAVKPRQEQPMDVTAILEAIRLGVEALKVG